MYTSVIILTIIYAFIILYVYIKYNCDAKDLSEDYEIYREKLEISASEAAYLLDKNCDSLDIILADILTLIEKQYIKMHTIGEGEQRDYIFTKIKDADNTKIKNHEIASYKLFFGDKEEVSLKEYLNNLKTDIKYLKELELKVSSIKTELEFELARQNIIDQVAEKKLFKINKTSISFVILFFILFIGTMFVGNNEIFEFSTVGLLFSILLYIMTNIKQDKLTEYGAKVKKQVKGFKKFLEEHVITEDKPLYMVNVLEYNYIMAVAFGMAKLGQNEFIHNRYKDIQRGKLIGNIISLIIITIIILMNVL